MKTLCRVLGVLLCAGATARAADIDALVKQLKDKDSDARRKAVKELGEAGKDAQPAAPRLLRGERVARRHRLISINTARTGR